MSGQGPMRNFWYDRLSLLPMEKIEIYFEWFSNADYPLLCGSVDYGLCFHDSVSQIDLPIKILDMFSCKVPVVAYLYAEVLKELVENNVSGLLFKNSDQLYQIMTSIVRGKEDL